jgi:hypothetical protein
MDLEPQADTDWIRAATLAHMLLSQSLDDEQLDRLVRRPAVQAVEPLTPRRAA